MGDILVGNLPDFGGRHIAFGFRPLRIKRCHMVKQELECRFGIDTVMLPHLSIGALFDTRHSITAVKRRISDILVPGFDHAVRQIPNQGLAGPGVAHVIAVWPDQIGRCRILLQRPNVAGVAPVTLNDHSIDQRKQERGIRLRLDRKPFGRQSTGDR